METKSTKKKLKVHITMRSVVKITLNYSEISIEINMEKRASKKEEITKEENITMGRTSSSTKTMIPCNWANLYCTTDIPLHKSIWGKLR